MKTLSEKPLKNSKEHFLQYKSQMVAGHNQMKKSQYFHRSYKYVLSVLSQDNVSDEDKTKFIILMIPAKCIYKEFFPQL